MGVALATTAVSGSSCFFVAVAASAATAMDADATADAEANPCLTEKEPCL